MLAELARKLRLYGAIAILAVGVLVVYGVDEGTDRVRHITVTVTWKQRPKGPQPGHIDVMGQIGRSAPFFAEITDDNPFIEAGTAFPGERVTVTAWAVDGPFAEFGCAIAGPVNVTPPIVWPGLQVMCSGIVR